MRVPLPPPPPECMRTVTWTLLRGAGKQASMAASHLILLSHEASWPFPALPYPTPPGPTLDSLMDRQISVQHALNIDLLPCLPSFHVCDIAFVITLICTVSVVCRLVFFFPQSSLTGNMWEGA